MHLPALRHRHFRNYLAGLTVSNIGTNVQNWAIFYHVYLLTDSSFMVGLIGLVRIGPLLLLTLFGGVLADQADRRKVMLATQSGMSLTALAAFAMTATGNASVGLLYGVVALHAVFRAFDAPARHALIVRLVPPGDFLNAASVNGIAWRASDVLGPVITGALIAAGGGDPSPGLALCYAFNFVSFFAVFAAVRRLPPCLPEEFGERPRNAREVLASIKEGIAFVRRTPVVRSAMWVDFWATLCSGAEALLPAMATKVLKLDEFGYGVLAGSAATGALIAAVAMAGVTSVARPGRVVVAMIACYGFFTILFGLSQSLWTAALCLAAVGASDMVSTVIRQTIRQLATPDTLRGRMNATSSLFHISGPQLGDFEAGAVAALLGERASIVLGGAACLVVASHWSRAKALVGYSLKETPENQIKVVATP